MCHNPLDDIQDHFGDEGDMPNDVGQIIKLFPAYQNPQGLTAGKDVCIAAGNNSPDLPAIFNVLRLAANLTLWLHVAVSLSIVVSRPDLR